MNTWGSWKQSSPATRQIGKRLEPILQQASVPQKLLHDYAHVGRKAVDTIFQEDLLRKEEGLAKATDHAQMALAE
eukprot:12915632-Prorocentrum_lima.AAC.1